MSSVAFHTIKDNFCKMQTFIYETPLSIVATLVAGIAALILFPKFAPALIGIAAAAFFTRVAVKCIESYNLSQYVRMNETLDRLNTEYGSLIYMAYATTLVVSALSPNFGMCLGIGVGIYKGMLIELQIQKLKQDSGEDSANGPRLSALSWINPFR
jgi:hypothetical protein